MKIKSPIIMLCDNGSTKPEATLQLRSIAEQLSNQTNKKIHPVSLQHSHRVPAEKSGGIKAFTIKYFLRKHIEQGNREFIILPLFFGKSRALTKFIPTVQEELEESLGEFSIQILDPLYTHNSNRKKGLSDIILDHIHKTAQSYALPLNNIVLVDHGSPIPQITAVRNGIAEEVNQKLEDGVQIEQAAMERREGKEYDFNGQLLEAWLNDKAEQGETSAIVTLLFLLPGRHAGEGGDIVTICYSVMQRHPNFKIGISPLVGENPLLLEILADRLNAYEGALT
jgi:sirohydrochlorin ferrochelatase